MQEKIDGRIEAKHARGDFRPVILYEDRYQEPLVIESKTWGYRASLLGGSLCFGTPSLLLLLILIQQKTSGRR